MGALLRVCDGYGVCVYKCVRLSVCVFVCVCVWLMFVHHICETNVLVSMCNGLSVLLIVMGACFP